MSEWCTIESDPGVFTELIKNIGVKGVEVQEIFSLEDTDFMKSLLPIHGLIFLFKWVKDPEPRQCLEIWDQDLFFANQEVHNACATQAILSVLLNSEGVDIGEELQNFRAITDGMDPQLKGLALGECELIRTVHNSFARPEPFIVTHDPKSKKKGEAFHFVAYIPFKGKLYELDGLQRGPLLLGDCTKDDWLDIAKFEINKRIAKYSEELRFTLLAVSGSKKERVNAEINDINIRRGQLYAKYVQFEGILDSETKKEAEELIAKAKDAKPLIEMPGNLDGILSKLSELNGEISAKKWELQEEEAKFKKYEEENIRRRHNYIPFILELLKLTAKKGKLKELVEAAKEKQKAKASNKASKK